MTMPLPAYPHVLPLPEDSHFWELRPDKILLWDKDGRYHDVHFLSPPRHLQPEAFLGRRITEVFPTSCGAILLDLVQRALKTQQRLMTTINLTFPSGKHQWCLIRLIPFQRQFILGLVNDYASVQAFVSGEASRATYELALTSTEATRPHHDAVLIHLIRQLELTTRIPHDQPRTLILTGPANRLQFFLAALEAFRIPTEPLAATALAERRTPQVLVIEDDPHLATLLHDAISEAGYAVHLSTSAREAREWLTSHTADLLLLDIFLPDEDGLSFLAHFRSEHPGVPVIVMTGRARDIEGLNLQTLARWLGAHFFVEKPFEITFLFDLLRTLLP
ncbi:MAG: response regulator [Nitrospirae bacterium]|nr:MAG: response regulator [Nitrospirota bacterium]